MCSIQGWKLWALASLPGLGGAMTGCTSMPAPREGPPKSLISEHATRETAEGLRIHALRAGWVRVKKTHRELDPPAFLRFPRVIADDQWADWMPIVVYAIERRDGSIVLVDAGASPQINDEGYFACDPRNDWFYRRNLRFDVADGDHLAARMAQAGLDLERVTHIVISHFHADHVGSISLFPRAEVLVGPGNWPKHTGSFTCQLGEEWSPTIARYRAGPIRVFESSLVIGDDARIRMIPLPGHTPGHAGVLVTGSDRAWLFAGDATFDLDQTERLSVAGATQDVSQARKTQALIKEAVRQGVVLLPAHDPDAFERLERVPKAAN